MLEMNLWKQTWNHATWRQYLRQSREDTNEGIRRSTHTGRPLGLSEFIQAPEKEIQRKLAPKKGGRPEKSAIDANQGEFSF